MAVPETAPQDLAFLVGPSGQNTTGSLFPFCPAHPKGSCKNRNGITNQRKSLSLASSFTTLFTLRQHSGLEDVSAALLEHYCLKALNACSFLCDIFPSYQGQSLTYLQILLQNTYCVRLSLGLDIKESLLLFSWLSCLPNPASCFLSYSQL